MLLHQDFVCIDLFCEIYEPGLSTLPEELKPHSFDQVPDWIKIVESTKFGYARNVDSQNGDNNYTLEKKHTTVQTSEKNMSENEVPCCMDEDINCNQIIINTCANPCSSKEDEDTWDDNKVNMYECFSCDISNDGKVNEIQGVIPYHVVVSENNVCVADMSLQNSDYSPKVAASSINSEEFKHGSCSDDFSCDENHDEVDGSNFSSEDCDCFSKDDVEAYSSHEECNDINVHNATCTQVKEQIACGEYMEYNVGSLSMKHVHCGSDTELEDKEMCA